MKDFYKILGVKEDASEEEIRERWVELTKQYHPDRSEASTSDEKIREINEAYQVLKHSSTRVEYDLKRAYGRGEEKSKRGSYFKKFGLPASILIISIIVGVIYIKNFETNQINQRNQINQTNQINKMNQTSRNSSTAQSPDEPQPPIAASTLVAPTPPCVAPSIPKPQPQVTKANQASLSREMRSLFHWDQTDQRNQINQKDQRNETDKKSQISSSTPRPKDVMSQITPSVAVAATAEKVQLPPPPQNSVTPLANDVAANNPTPSVSQTDRRKNQRNGINQTDQIDFKIEPVQLKPALLLATEDEVKKFFDNYVNYYNHKNAKDILSLFSSKAIQNQKDGLEEIRKIYVDFFNEGREIHYSLQDMKIEIYENAVEVKARYEIELISKATGEKEVWRGPIRWVLIREDGRFKILSVDFKYHRLP